MSQPERERRKDLGLETYMSDEGRKGGREGVGSLDSRKTWKWGGVKGREERIICEDGRGLVHPQHEKRPRCLG